MSAHTPSRRVSRHERAHAEEENASEREREREVTAAGLCLARLNLADLFVLQPVFLTRSFVRSLFFPCVAVRCRYYAQPLDVKKVDERPHFHYQVGVTPEGVEVPRCSMDPACLKEIEDQAEENKATVPKGADPKWRFMHRVGPR